MLDERWLVLQFTDPRGSLRAEHQVLDGIPLPAPSSPADWRTKDGAWKNSRYSELGRTQHGSGGETGPGRGKDLPATQKVRQGRVDKNPGPEMGNPASTLALHLGAEVTSQSSHCAHA